MSTEAGLPRARVLRGAAAAAMRGASMDADLGLLRPLRSGAVPAAEHAEEAARELRQEARRVGYDDGYQAGLAAAADEMAAQRIAAKQRIEAALATLEAAAAAVGGRQQIVVAEMEQQITSVGVSVAEAILRRELAACDQPALEAIGRALQLAPPRVDALARVHPDDAATIAELGTLTADRMVTIVPDGSIERGGCVLEIGPCRIDAQITPALQRVQEVLAS